MWPARANQAVRNVVVNLWDRNATGLQSEGQAEAMSNPADQKAFVEFAGLDSAEPFFFPLHLVFWDHSLIDIVRMSWIDRATNGSLCRDTVLVTFRGWRINIQILNIRKTLGQAFGHGRALSASFLEDKIDSFIQKGFEPQDIRRIFDVGLETLTLNPM